MQPIKRSIFPLFSLALFLLVFFNSSGVSANHDQGLQRGYIIIGSELDYPPYALVTKTGEPDGFSVDLIKAVCDAMEIKYRFKVGPWSEVRGALEKQKIDALPLVGYTKERDAVFDFTKPHTPAFGVIFKKRNAPGIESLDDLKGKTIVAMRSDNTHDYLIKNRITEKIVTVETMEDVFTYLESGAYDYAIGPRLVGLSLLNKKGMKNIETTGPLIKAYGNGYSFAVHEGDAILLSLLNQGLSVVKANGTYDVIYQKWFGIIDPPDAFPRETLKKVILGFIGLFVVFLLIVGWSLSLRRKVYRRTKELHESKKRYADLYDNSPDMFYSVDARTAKVLQCNRTLADKLGLRKEEIIGHPVFDLYHPDCQEEVRRAFESFITTGEVANADLILKTGKEEKTHVILNASAVRDKEGNVVYSRSTLRDITEMKIAEETLRRAKEELEELNKNLEKRVEEETEKRVQQEHLLVQQAKMAAMGEMLSAIAHQWRQPLNSLGLVIQDIKDAYEYDELSEEYIDNTIRSSMSQIQFMSKTINDFSNFFRPSKEKKAFDILEAINAAASLISSQAKNRRIMLNAELQEYEDRFLIGYQNEFEQALLNILHNAVDAVTAAYEEGKVEESRGCITIRSSQEGKRIVIEVEDNGGGIEEKHLSRIFEPYFTTKDEGKGTGIGLYMAQMIIKNMDGELSVENISGGACFRIRFDLLLCDVQCPQEGDLLRHP